MDKSFIGLAAAAALSLLAPSPAAADTANKQDKADASFQAGRELLKDKRYADACPKFEESQREDPASGTQLALAYCQELSGLLATSWSNYLAAALLAEREGHADRQAAALERARALAERVSKLTVVVPRELLDLPGFHLLRDGIEFERASFGVPIPMNGGAHSFEATAPGRAAWSSTVTLLSERDNKTLVLPVLDAAGAANASAPNGASASPLPAPAPPRDAKADSVSSVNLKRASLAFAAGSVLGLGLGTAYALSAASKNSASNANGHCDGSGCDRRGIELRNDALSAARTSTWFFVASGALAACSVTLYLTAGASPGPETRVSAHAGPGAGGVELVRSF